VADVPAGRSATVETEGGEGRREDELAYTLSIYLSISIPHIIAVPPYHLLSVSLPMDARQARLKVDEKDEPRRKNEN
jgi:hypothetical protein